MAVAIETAIRCKSSLIVEAGTGTGKNFAYLAPALLPDKKPLILPKICKSPFFIVTYRCLKMTWQ